MTIASEITVGGPAFAAAVSWVAKWVPSKPVVPVQGGIMISASVDGESVVLSAFGESVTARALTPARWDTDADAQFAIVSARLLDALAGTLGKGDVTIGPGPDGTAQLTQGRFVATLPTLPDTNWPTLPGTLKPIGEVNGDAFAAVVKRVGLAGGDTDAKPVAFACMRLGFTSDVIEVMAATREHAACASMPWSIDPEAAAEGDYADYFPSEATPLVGTMMDAAAAFAGPDPVAIGCSGGMLSFSSPTRALTVRTVVVPGEGWPANTVRAIAATRQPHAIVMQPAEAVVPMRRAAIVRGKSGPILWTFAPGEIRLTSAAEDAPTAGDDVIDAEGYEGDEMPIAFNPEYVADALAAAPGDKVTMTFEAPHRPMILSCDADPTWRHAVMPMRRR